MRNKYKKGISIMLVMLMVIGGFSGILIPVEGRASAAGSFAAGAGKAEDPYQIATADQLNQVRYYLEAGIYFKLTADIDLTGYNWEPIGKDIYNDSNYYFKGNIDGNGFKIRNLTINRAGMDTVGLFGVVYQSVISNMILENVDVKGRSYVGALVGTNYSEGIVSNSSSTGTVSGATRIGGLVADNYGTIRNSYSTANVTGSDLEVGGLVGQSFGTIRSSYATGTVIQTGTAYGTGRAGGLVGINSGPISDSYAAGSVTGSYDVGGLVGNNNGYFGGTISNSYATGAVSATTLSVGGLIGTYPNAPGNFADSYYDSTTSGKSDTGKGVGKTTAELQTQSTFANWNFSSVWYMLPGEYPKLWLGGLAQGTDAGTTKLENVSGMDYSTDAGGSYTTISGTVVDNIEANAGDTILLRVTAHPSLVKTLTVALTDIKPAAPPEAVLAMGTTTGTTKLTDVTSAMAYKINSGAYTAIAGTSVDDIAVIEGDRIYIRVQETALQPASAVQELTVAAAHIKPTLTIKIAAIAGVTAPVLGETPASTVTETAEYTGTVTWSPAVTTVFEAGTAYTATITVTPKTGYTLEGVEEDFFTVGGATTVTNPADSGVVTAEFPATASVVNEWTLDHLVTAPVKHAAASTTPIDAPQYTGTVAWFESDGVTSAPANFAAETAYTAKVNLAAKAGYTLAGIAANSFTYTGAIVTHAADSGEVTITFSDTASETPEVTNVTVSPSTASVAQGETKQLTAVVAVLHGAAQTVSWTSSDSKVSVDGDGFVTAAEDAAPGDYTITATSTDNSSKTGTATITVTAAELAAPVNLVAVAGDSQIDLNWSSVTGSTYYNVYQSLDNVTYQLISSPAALTAYQVTGLTNGSLYYFQVTAANTFTESVHSSHASATPTASPVAPTVISVAVSPATASVAQGQTKQLAAAVAVAGGAAQTVAWTSSDTQSKVVVDANGFVTVAADAAAGDYTITATSTADSRKLGTATLTVTAATTGGSGGSGGSGGGTVTVPTATPAPTPTPTSTPVPTSPMVEVFNDGMVNQANLVKTIEAKVAEAKEANIETKLADVTGHWAEKTIHTFVKLHFIDGYGAGQFKPNGKITRAEFAMLISRIFNISDGTKQSAAFKDVNGHWAKEAIENLSRAGVLGGYSDGSFKPNQTISREEMVILLSRIVNLDRVDKDASKGSFTDMSHASSYAGEAIKDAAAAGIISGKSGGSFDPQGNATRAEALTVILNVLRLDPQVKALLDSLT